MPNLTADSLDLPFIEVAKQGGNHIGAENQKPSKNITRSKTSVDSNMYRALSVGARLFFFVKMALNFGLLS